MTILGQEQQPEGKPPPNLQVYPRMMPVPDQDFFKYRLTTEDILEEIEHKLKGEVFVSDEKGNRWETKYARWVNDEGISIILSIVYDYTNKNVILGCFDKDEIYYKCKTLKKELALLFFKKSEEYGIEKARRTLVLKKVVDTVHSSLSRCEGGREADLISTSSQRHDIHQYQDENERGTGWSPLKFLKGRRYG